MNLFDRFFPSDLPAFVLHLLIHTEQNNIEQIKIDDLRDRICWVFHYIRVSVHYNCNCVIWLI